MHAREKHQRLGEDDRHDAAVIHAQRQELPAVRRTPAGRGVLGLLDRNAALGLGDEDRPRDDEDKRQRSGTRILAGVDRFRGIVLVGLERDHAS